MLREALASNTIGGRGSDEGRWRAMGDDVRQAQAAWSRLGPVPGQAGRELTERFHRATNRFMDQYRRRVPQTPQSGPGGRPRRNCRPVSTSAHKEDYRPGVPGRPSRSYRTLPPTIV